jgi:hypothetical protein
MVPYLDLIYSDIKDLEDVMKLPSIQQMSNGSLLRDLILSRGWSMDPQKEVKSPGSKDTKIASTVPAADTKVKGAEARSNSLSQVEKIVHYRIRRFLRRQKRSKGKTFKQNSVKGRHTNMKFVRPKHSETT